MTHSYNYMNSCFYFLYKYLVAIFQKHVVCDAKHINHAYSNVMHLHSVRVKKSKALTLTVCFYVATCRIRI